jgi:hypothetical protein
MQDVNQVPGPDPVSGTTQDPVLHEPGMDAMDPAAGNPSSDAGGDPASRTATGAAAEAKDKAEDGHAQ